MDEINIFRGFCYENTIGNVYYVDNIAGNRLTCRRADLDHRDKCYDSTITKLREYFRNGSYSVADPQEHLLPYRAHHIFEEEYWVEVIHTGGTYSTYCLAFDIFKMDSSKRHGCSVGDKGKIIETFKHHADHDKILCLIEREDGSKFIMEANDFYLKKITAPKLTPKFSPGDIVEIKEIHRNKPGYKWEGKGTIIHGKYGKGDGSHRNYEGEVIAQAGDQVLVRIKGSRSEDQDESEVEVQIVYETRYLKLKSKSINNQLNQINHGKTIESCSGGKAIKISRPLPRVSRGKRPSGITVRGRASRSAVKSRHLSYANRVVKS